MAEQPCRDRAAAEADYYKAQAEALRYHMNGWAEHDAKIQRRLRLQREYRVLSLKAQRAVRARLVARASQQQRQQYQAVASRYKYDFSQYLDPYDANGNLRAGGTDSHIGVKYIIPRPQKLKNKKRTARKSSSNGPNTIYGAAL